MNSCPPDQATLARFAAQVEALPPRPHHSTLLEAAGHLIPDCKLRYAFSRGGWYRPGGVIRPDGTRVADDLEAWAEAELDDCGGDMDAFLERHADDGLLATRHVGRTHFFVVPRGPGAAEFLQLEVEELQEVLDRHLVDPDAPPADLPELTDPAAPQVLPPQPVGRPRYRFRRLTDMAGVAARQPAPPGGLPPLNRFLREWSASRAAEKGHFCHHWIISLREQHDRYQNLVISASPLSLHARKLRTFHWNPAARGVELGNQLHAFDRVAGYPCAWYFHLVAGALVPRDIAYAVGDDLVAGFKYLGDDEDALLEGWLRNPYSV